MANGSVISKVRKSFLPPSSSDALKLISFFSVVGRTKGGTVKVTAVRMKKVPLSPNLETVVGLPEALFFLCPMKKLSLPFEVDRWRVAVEELSGWPFSSDSVSEEEELRESFPFATPREGEAGAVSSPSKLSEDGDVEPSPEELTSLTAGLNPEFLQGRALGEAIPVVEPVWCWLELVFVSITKIINSSKGNIPGFGTTVAVTRCEELLGDLRPTSSLFPCTPDPLRTTNLESIAPVW